MEQTTKISNRAVAASVSNLTDDNLVAAYNLLLMMETDETRPEDKFDCLQTVSLVKRINATRFRAKKLILTLIMKEEMVSRFITQNKRK